MQELVQQRTLCSKTYDLGDYERRLVCSQEPMHYDNNGVLEDINMCVENNGVHKCGYDVDLFTDKIGYYGTAPDGKAISVELEEIYVEPVIDGNKVTYPDVSKDTDLVIVFQPLSIRVNRVLKSKNAKKSVIFKIKREEGLEGDLRSLGADAEGKKTKLSVAENLTGVKDEVQYVQTWSGDVAVMNPTTRKKEWSNKDEDVKYPIEIDPTVDFKPSSGSNNKTAYGTIVTQSGPYQGYVKFSTFSTNNFNDHILNPKTIKVSAPTPTSPPTYLYGYRKKGAYTRFVVTIPDGSNVTSASLNLYCCDADVPTYGHTVKVKIDNRNPTTIAVPTTVKQVFQPANVEITTETISITNKGNIFNKTAFDLYNDGSGSIDVTGQISNLITNYDYSSGGEMIVYTNSPIPPDWGPPPTKIQTGIGIYGRQWGTTKAPELSITYSAPPNSSSSSSEAYSSSSSDSSSIDSSSSSSSLSSSSSSFSSSSSSSNSSSSSSSIDSSSSSSSSLSSSSSSSSSSFSSSSSSSIDSSSSSSLSSFSSSSSSSFSSSSSSSIDSSSSSSSSSSVSSSSSGSIVQFKSFGLGRDTTDTCVISKPSGLAIDDLMVAQINVFDDGITTPAGWTQIAATEHTSCGMFIYWKIADAADVAASSFDFVLDNGANTHVGCIGAFTGASTINPIPAGDIATGSGTSLSTIGMIQNTSGNRNN